MDQSDSKDNGSVIDAGRYNKKQEDYARLLAELYETYKDGVTLSPEYASFIETDLLRFLIRLARYKFITRMIKPSDRVLEVGSGSGLGCIYLSQYCKHVTGIDVKTTEINEAKALNKRSNIEFLAQDFFDYAPDEKFDVIVSLDVIEHMPVDLGHKLIAHKSKLVKDNGLVIVGTPSIYSYPHQGALSQASHENCYDLPDLLQLIDSYVQRTISFSMNDELVHTGHHKMAWYYFVIGFGNKEIK